MALPLLIGGATTSRVHTALRIDPAYDGPVIHVLDASRAVGVASVLVSDTQREPLIEKTAADYHEIRETRAGRGHSELATLAEARANAFPWDPAGKAPPPQRPGRAQLQRLAAARACATASTGRPSSAPGSWPAIIRRSSTDPVVGESASSLFADAQAMLDRIVAEHWLTVRGTVGLWRCRREGDDILVLAGNDETRLPMLRQQVKKREGRAEHVPRRLHRSRGRGLDRRLRGRHPRHRAAPRPLQGRQ